MIAIVSIITTAHAGNKSQTFKVKTAEEFIRALGPDRTIIITTDKPLNITDALERLIERGEIAEGSTYYNAADEPAATGTVTYGANTDGNALQVRSCDGLHIRAKKGTATLLATPRYVNVLEFINCNFVEIDHIVMGHTVGGYCDKGVVEFDGCSQVTINDCDFFGCGTEGFVFEFCNRVTVNRSCVHDCTYYTMHIRGCNQVRFNDCTFSDNREFEQICVARSSDVTFTGCRFDNLQGPLFALDDYVDFYCCTFRNCNISAITDDFYPQGFAVLAYCTTSFGDAQLSQQPTAKLHITTGRWTDGEHTYMVKQSDPYRYLFTSTDGFGGVFAINSVSAARNDFVTAPEYPYENQGRYGVDFVTQGNIDFIRIRDDGGELIKSLTCLEGN